MADEPQQDEEPVEKPQAEEPVAEEPQAEEPAAEEPQAEAPVAEEKAKEKGKKDGGDEPAAIPGADLEVDIVAEGEAALPGEVDEADEYSEHIEADELSEPEEEVVGPRDRHARIHYEDYLLVR